MPKPCPISRTDFAATPVEVYLVINGVRYDLTVRDVADPTESLGWTTNERDNVQIGDKKVPAMIQAHVTLIGSKLERNR